MIDYSVIIRTTGKAGEKYRKLLSSIDSLVPKPKEVIVVLPEGYDLPTDQLGWETFYFCPKGMVIQRMVGIANCKTKYALITDDDIAFESDFVQKLHAPLADEKYSISAGPLVEFFPRSGFPAIMSILTGASGPSIFHRERYNTVWRTTGYSYNRNIKIGSDKLYETQSAAWTCFYADIIRLKSIRFDDEQIWLDKNGYSAHDDTAMFYKAWLRGEKSVIVANAPYQHLDAKTSTRGNMETVLYASGFNDVVFWHRYLKGDNLFEQIWSKLCIHYRFLSQSFYNRLNKFRSRMTSSEINAFESGVKDGWKWIKTEEYNSIPSIMEDAK